MIDAKQAAEKAAEYLRSLVPVSSIPVIEEIERSDDGQFWLVTLSYQPPMQTGLYLAPHMKEYKLFKVDANAGDVRSMKIRAVK